mgnify:CR=1 FL=1
MSAHTKLITYDIIHRKLSVPIVRPQRLLWSVTNMILHIMLIDEIFVYCGNEFPETQPQNIRQFVFFPPQ